jgi:hypothetical protein
MYSVIGLIGPFFRYQSYGSGLQKRINDLIVNSEFGQVYAQGRNNERLKGKPVSMLGILPLPLDASLVREHPQVNDELAELLPVTSLSQPPEQHASEMARIKALDSVFALLALSIPPVYKKQWSNDRGINRHLA